MGVFFVGGVNRSGSTLLQSILCSDPKANPLVQEASYLRFITDAWAFGNANFDFHSKYYFDSRQDLLEFTAEWLDKFLNKFRGRYPEAEHLVLRYLPITARFPQLNELMLAIGEQSHYIVIIRDPRDVVASLVQVGERAKESNDSGAEALGRNIPNLCKIYMDVYGPLFSNKDPQFRGALTSLRYEDLVTKPGQTLAQLREATGLNIPDYSPGSQWQRNEMDMELKHPWMSDLWGKGLTADRIGSYQKVLRPEEVSIVEQICASPLQGFGYS